MAVDQSEILGSPSRSGTLTSQGWRPKTDKRMTYARWAEEGRTILLVHTASKWALGDWVAYGENTFGEKYVQAVDDLGFSAQYIANAKWVATRFPPGERSERLSWSHHEAVAGLPVEHAHRLLNLAIDNQWSMRELREKVAEMKSIAREIVTAPVLGDQDGDSAPLSEADILRRAKEIRQQQNIERRAERVERIAAATSQNKPLPERKYAVIYADPPWKFEAGDSDRSVENHYPTMTIDDIKALPVGDIAHDDCACFMWVTVPHLANGIETLAAWGFEYKTCWVWVKDRISTGFWNRNQHELLLLGTRGEIPAPLPSELVSSVVSAKLGKHSEKPLDFYAIIERMFPELDRIELFARVEDGKEPRDGWSVWGNMSGA